MINVNLLKEIARCAVYSLKVYALTDLIRARGIVFSFISITLWLALLILPISLFTKPGISPSIASAYIFCGLLVFNVYSTATWDWAWGMRLLINYGVLDYIIASGRNPLVIYLGIVPISLFWIVSITLLGYSVVTFFIAPPSLMVADIGLLLYSIIILLIVVLSYALLLAIVILVSGTSGAIIEILSWILPLATGGFTPLSYFPKLIRLFALLTPFSYPAELLRFSLGVSEPILPLKFMIYISAFYSILFFSLTLLLFKYGLNKILREGVKSLAVW